MEVVSSLAVRALEIVAQHSEDSLSLGLPPAPFAGSVAGPPGLEAAMPQRDHRDDGAEAHSSECAALSCGNMTGRG